MASRKDEIRELAEADFETFIRLVTPLRVLGSIHSEICEWWTRQGAKSHQLLLLPRDHQKSALAGYYAAWQITKNPAIRILYVSSTSNLAIKQLKFIKDILTCDIYRRYWPEMVSPDEGRREKWTETEISVDHPKRRYEAIRDSTVFAAGLTTNVVGLHCDLTVLDDTVTGDNATTEDGREKTKTQYSLLSSVEGTEARQIVVGTRYDPRDLYNDLIQMSMAEFDDYGNVINEEPLYEVFERKVEDRGDGYGQFLWPRQQRQDGRWFGFDAKILARKKAQYLDPVQFRAQYYNEPNDFESAAIKPEYFQYYETKHLERQDGQWFYRQKRLNLFASIDFAFSLNKKADYTAIVVIGVDNDKNYFVLDIDRFKTDRIDEYFDHILRLHQKWDFRKIKAEVTSAQAPIVKSLKNDYIRTYGLALAVEDFAPTRNQGNKEERINAVLQAKYNNRQMWHYRGYNCQTLEEELIRSKPPHDDIKDALASAVDSAVAPSRVQDTVNAFTRLFVTPNKFGGMA